MEFLASRSARDAHQRRGFVGLRVGERALDALGMEPSLCAATPPDPRHRATGPLSRVDFFALFSHWDISLRAEKARFSIDGRVFSAPMAAHGAKSSFDSGSGGGLAHEGGLPTGLTCANRGE